MGRDKAKRKGKAWTSSTSSTTGSNVESLAKLTVNDYAMVNDPYTVQKGLNMIQLFEKKKIEMELKAKGLEIRQMDQRKKDEAIYMSTTDEELKRVIRAKWNLTF
nr:hypothetical protein [Tanacetum cinerariifolium]